LRGTGLRPQDLHNTGLTAEDIVKKAAAFRKAAFDMNAVKAMGGKALEFAKKNPGVVGSAAGAGLGAAAAGPGNRLEGAVGGGVLGGGLAHAGYGIGSRLNRPGATLDQAVKGYTTNTRRRIQAGTERAKRWLGSSPTQGAKPAVPDLNLPAPAQPSLPGIG